MRDEDRESHLYPTLPQQNDLNKAENGSASNAVDDDDASSGKRNKKFSNKGAGMPPTDNHIAASINALDEKKDYKYFWRRVLTDLTNKNLIPVKILFFFKYATLFVLYPFLAIHMKSLGLDEWEIGVNQASVPIVAILGPPVSGVIADRIGNFKLVLTFITLANAAVALLLLLVPVARETVTLPSNITFEIGCESAATNNFILQSIDPYDCTLTGFEWFKLPRDNVLHCGQLCRNSINETISGDKNNSNNDLEMFPPFPLTQYFSNFSIAQNNESNIFYSDFGNQPRFECVVSSTIPFQEECKITNAKYDITNDDGDRKDYFSLLSFSKLKLLHKMESVNNFSSSSTPEVNGKVERQPKFRIEGQITFDGEVHENPVCTRQPSPTEDENNDFNDCKRKCFLQMERKLICSNDKTRKVYNVWLTFGVYTAFRLLLGFASATSFIMFEGAVLAILKQYGGDYGLQRVSATFAAMIAAPLSGALLQHYSFRPVFYLYATLQAISAALTLKIDLKFKKPTENVLNHLKEVLSKAEILIFFIAMLCSGTFWGYLETFLFLFLQQLGGSETLMGLTITVGGIFGLPFLIFSRPLIKRVGHVNILSIGLLFYGIRLFGYSTINNPWLCLPFEAMEAITSSLAVTAAATYAVALSTLQTIATVQGIMGALYFGIGRGTGSFIGGVLIKKFGHRMTFQLFGIGAFFTCVLYMLVNLLYIRRHSLLNSATVPDSNNLNGLVISNGSAKMKGPDVKEHFQMKPANHDADLGFGKVNPGFDDGDLEDGKFTDIPLDEDNNSTLPHNFNHRRV